MSRIGKMPVEIPAGVEFKLENDVVTIKGSKGTLSLTLMPNVSVAVENNQIIVKRNSDAKEDRAAHGLTRALIANLVVGVSKGFEKRLEIYGVGYKAEGGGTSITMHLGFSHPVVFKAPAGITVELDPEKKNGLIIKGADKQKVGQFAAEIRKLRKPEPYKGKGVHYSGEKVLRKAGKKAGSK